MNWIKVEDGWMDFDKVTSVYVRETSYTSNGFRRYIIRYDALGKLDHIFSFTEFLTKEEAQKYLDDFMQKNVLKPATRTEWIQSTAEVKR